ncbi:MAG: HD domain-containing protein [Desulfotalea sp.]
MANKQLIEILNSISKGHYSNDIMELTRESIPDDTRNIAEAIGMMMVKIEAREYQLELMIEELKQLNEQMRMNSIAAVSAMADALAARDRYTEGHTLRVAHYCQKMADKFNLSQEEKDHLYVAAVLHDIGKIGFPDSLFQARGADGTTSHMIKEIVKHPLAGYEIIRKMSFLGPVAEYVYCHHECLDGTGYPRKLKEKDIPLAAKMISVADSFDAITTDRPYQKGMSRKKAIEILEGLVGTKIDGACLEALKEVLANEQEEITKLTSSASCFDILDADEFYQTLALQKGLAVADLSCGAGISTEILTNRLGEKAEIFAVDLWKNGIAILDKKIEQQNIENIYTLRSDVTRHIPIDDKRVNFCLLTTHFAKIMQRDTIVDIMDEIKRILRKKGRLAILEFTEESPYLQKHPEAGIAFKHERLKEIVSEQGFKHLSDHFFGDDLTLTIFRK